MYQRFTGSIQPSIYLLTKNTTPMSYGKLFCLILGCWWWSSVAVHAQKKCGKSTASTSITLAQQSSAKRSYRLPTNYRPPTADPKQTVFPETFANKKRQKKLRKRRKKNGHKGCSSARF